MMENDHEDLIQFSQRQFIAEIERAREWLKDVQFLNWKFYVTPTGVLQMRTVTPNTQLDRQVLVELFATKDIPQEAMNSRAAFYIFVFDAISYRLRHEASELFKVKGKQILNEHDRGKVMQEPYYYRNHSQWDLVSEIEATLVLQMTRTCDQCDVDKNTFGDHYTNYSCYRCGRQFEIMDGKVNRELPRMPKIPAAQAQSKFWKLRKP